MHFLKCMVPLPVNSSICFPPASSNQLWSPTHLPYSRDIGLHAKTQPNIFGFRVLIRCIVSLMVSNLGTWEFAWKLRSTYCDTPHYVQNSIAYILVLPLYL